MKAYAAIEPGKCALIELPIPEPDDYEVLVHNEGCVFCNTTDRMIADGQFAFRGFPVVIGHESFGTVVKVGAKVKKYRLGDRVICSNAIVNNYNGEVWSAWGGFAEYGIAGDLDAYLADFGTLDGENAYRGRYKANSIIPADLPVRKAALAFPLSETAGALLTLGNLTGKNVAVIGTGIAGYSLTCFAKRYGAKIVATLGRRESRMETARAVGADVAFTDPDEAAAFFKGIDGADIVIEASGNDRVLEEGLPYLKNDGIFATYAVPHQPYRFDLLKCPNFSYKRIDPRVDDALELVCGLLRRDEIPVDRLLTHVWEFDQINEAFAQVRRGDVVKGLVLTR